MNKKIITKSYTCMQVRVEQGGSGCRADKVLVTGENDAKCEALKFLNGECGKQIFVKHYVFVFSKYEIS